MTRRPRWDTDTRFYGVRDATEVEPDLRRLLEAMSDPGWVAEDPEHHLLPHLQTAAAQLGVEVLGASTVDGVLVFRVANASPSRNEARRFVLALLGAIAEQDTYVRQDGDTFTVVTGSADEAAAFAPHGHLVRIQIE